MKKIKKEIMQSDENVLLRRNSGKKPKATDLSEIDRKYLPERPEDPNAINVISEDPATINAIYQAARNAQENARQAIIDTKRHEEDQQKFDEHLKQQREFSEQERKARSQLPRRQFENFVSGKFSRPTCLISYYPDRTTPNERSSEIGSNYRNS